MNDSYKILKDLFDKYELEEYERKEIFDIIKNIFVHEEFQKRFSKEFMHHGSISLSEHILEDTILTYILVKNSKKIINLEYALKISMMHDLYTLPWQNMHIKKSSFFYKHGFSHPLEAVINSISWFPEEFDDEIKSKILIDGILHHMYPLPVLSFNYNGKELELHNYKLLKNISKKHKEMIYESTNRYKMGKISLSRSKYLEGRIMSRSDKLSCFKELGCIEDALALVTGVNKTLY